MSITAASLVLGLVCGRTALASADDARQILWQRSLADALAIAQAEDRPLFIAVNMDGESASERIIREEYRDPQFVAATRPFVCVVASVFRHNSRDHDDLGRRIPCPRLGEITCGEHIELEPQLFEKYLVDGDRVAPRHAVVLQDGKKSWDLSLIFDLKDLDRALEESARTERERRAATQRPDPTSADPEPPWLGLAARRDQRGRSELEDAVAATTDAREARRAISAIGRCGDAGSIEALRLVSAHLVREEDPFDEMPALVAQELHLEAPLAVALKEDLRSLGLGAGGTGAEGVDALLPLLASLDGRDAGTRSMLLARLAARNPSKNVAAAVERAFGHEEAARIENALAAAGGPVPPQEALAAAAAVRRAGTDGSFPKPGPATDAMPEREALEASRSELLQQIENHRDDPEVCALFAKCSLDLGRTLSDEDPKESALMLADAEAWFAKALARKPDVFDWWVERARAAYFRNRFDEEATFGRRALASVLGAPDASGGIVPRASDASSVLADGRAIEALRWIGDADARLMSDRSGKDPVVELGGLVEGARALGLVAASAFADGNDWLSFASFHGGLGLRREKLAILEEGAARLPAAPELYAEINAVLWSAGRIDLAPSETDRIASLHPTSADASWFAGRAWILAAEDLRRREQPDAAIAAYTQAELRLERALTVRPDYAENSKWWIGASWLGRGFAQLLADRRADAADDLAKAVEVTPAIVIAKDGLDREVVDLVDGCLEWRASGPSPVDPLALLDRLEAAEPSSPFWAIAISDAELREALRSDGRNPNRVERETVDASGKKIRMPMGLPTEEGDVQLRASIAAARHAVKLGDTPENRQPLAQSLTIWGERMLDRDRPADARDALLEAARLMDVDASNAATDEAALRDLAVRLRAVLGDARPRYRPGR